MHHLLVVAVLVMAVSMSAMVRSYPLEHGYELNEFDPFFNFRATLVFGLDIWILCGMHKYFFCINWYSL